MSLKLTGVDELLKDMKAFGPTVSEKAAVVGLRKAAQLMRRDMRAAAPRGGTGNLRKSLQYKYSRPRFRGDIPIVRVGLRTNQFYSANWRGRKAHTRKGSAVSGSPPSQDDWLSRSINRSWEPAAKLIIEETRKALYTEAGKVYARSRMRRRR